MTRDRICPVCLRRMTDVGEPTHPNCQYPGQYTVTTGEALRDKGITAVSDANPDVLEAALTIIAGFARAEEYLSANTVRPAFKAAHIVGPVCGAAWHTAIKQRLVAPVGYTPSTDPRTRHHPIRTYKSLVWRAAA